ncbi:MAG: prolyl oligopeptidase family serine peptidase [Chloroflexi bacterium]|nr:prolyl oligopeptidase family serine peptidase [Chloroflexota bacterium]
MSDVSLKIPNGAVTLEALLHLPSTGKPPFPGIVVCHPHPLYGGSMHNNVVDAIVRGALSQGIAALRFNFRGVGASTGEHDNGTGEQTDAIAALSALRKRKEIDPKRTGIAGYSFGSIVATAVAPKDANLLALAAVAPLPTGLNTPAMLSWSKPKLFIPGDMDTFIPVEEVHEMTRRMAKPLRIEVLHGADHFMADYESDISEYIADFFKQALMV